jgi:hypothetical protein
MPNSNYNDQVFINCPFDDQYVNMFRACVFTILDAGFIPRCSKEVDNATVFRLSAIVDIMRDCRYGVHDLSRIELDANSRMPRFNMPFELGVFYSAKHFGNAQQKRKECLVLEKQQYRYQKFISDISGIDVTPHQNRQKKLILSVRNWLVTASRRTTIPPGETIHNRFNKFQTGMRRACNQRALDYDSMPFTEIVHNMTDWLSINQIIHVPIFVP